MTLLHAQFERMCFIRCGHLQTYHISHYICARGYPLTFQVLCVYLP